MNLVANEAAKFSDELNTYEDVDIDINFGRYTLLAVGEEMYNYIETITVNSENTTKEITVVAKNACGNGIVDSGEECEISVSGTASEVKCGDIYPAATYPEEHASCNPDTCVYDKAACGKAALCGDGIIDLGEGCDDGAKDCSEILGTSAKGTAPCAANCSDWITAGSCSRTLNECTGLPQKAIWNDGTGKFTQSWNGENWLPASMEGTFGKTRSECVFSCVKGYKWDPANHECIEEPLSLGNICTGQMTCSDSSATTACPVYGSSFFGQDAQYAAIGFCTQKNFSQKGSGEEIVIVDSYTHFEWQKAASTTAMSWMQADEHCMQSVYDGTMDWRLPTPQELLTIVDDAALAGVFGTSGTFWSTEDAGNSANAWRLGANGELTSVEKSGNNYVICIRDYNKETSEGRFTEDGETVSDNESGLIWQKNPASSKNWQEALSYCENSTAAGHYDWRLPNRNELASILDFTNSSGAANSFPGIAQNKFWTSTSAAAKAFAVNFASGSITAEAKSDTNYVLCVRSENICLGDESECVNACDFEPCRNTDHSTGFCTATGGTFYCGCKSGFSWNMINATCSVEETRYAACEGLPENAKWNTVSGISQMLAGDDWYPSNIGKYNENPSTKECNFICEGYFSWDKETEKCIHKTQLVSCEGILPEHAEWNTVSQIVQTWNGFEWLPRANIEFNETPSEEKCRFKCAKNYNWNGSACAADRQTVNCTNLPENASWNIAGNITQEWTGSKWEPSEIGVYSQTPSTDKCYFKCNYNYNWEEDRCIPKIQTTDCLIPENAIYNIKQTVTQTWDGNNWMPSEIAVYDENQSTTECRFKCDTNYFWSGSDCQLNPCEYEPCEDIANSTKTCTALSWNEYKCGCKSGYFWNGSTCKKALLLGNICTNQRTCYNASSSITCPTSASADFYGQDAQYRSKCTPQSFTLGTGARAGTVIDNNTGLTWEQSPSEATYTWANAKNHCADLNSSNYGGKSNWRVPNPLELLTIVDNSRYNPATNYSFTGMPMSNSTYLWTSKQYNGNTAYAYIFSPSSGWYDGFDTSGYLKSNTYKVLCVSGDEMQPVTSAKFTTQTINWNVVVTDSATGLMWQKSYATDKTWQQALKYCENSTYAGYSDWRLPNKNELVSLVNYEKAGAPYSDFPNMPSDNGAWWWSSSTNVNSGDHAWHLNISSAGVLSPIKSYPSYVRCVRSE